MKPPHAPKDHHYVPKFMLKSWLDGENLRRYTRPHKEVVVDEVGVGATGFQKFLYTMPGAPVEHAQILETDFFQNIDNDATKVHSLLRQGNLKGLTADERLYWARFILLMLFRSPRNLNAFKAGFKGAFNEPTPESAAIYATMKQPGMPASAEEFIERYQPDLVDHITMREFPRVAQSGSFGQHLLRMQWRVLRVDIKKSPSFVVSDEPIVMQTGLARFGGHLAMPIAPDAMFLATYDEATFQTIDAMRKVDIVRGVNKLLVQRAIYFVGAFDTSHDAFIKKHFGTKPSDTIATLFAERYGKK